VPKKAHPPLVAMLVLTQVAVGALVAHLAAGWLLPDASLSGERRATAVLAAVTGVVALGASVLHLGRPQYAWRAVIGLRHSWLSREVVAFGCFGPLSVGYAVLVWGDGWAPPWLVDTVRVLATVTGAAGVVCSVLVYTVTGRRWWRLRRTGPSFLATTAVGGLAAMLAMATLADRDAGELGRVLPDLATALAVASAVMLAAEGAVILLSRSRGADPDAARSTALLLGPLARTTAVRFGAGVLGGVVLPFLFVTASYGPTPPPAWLLVGGGIVTLLLVMIGEAAHRALFFQAELGPRMPGVPR
jgi:formate dehydrogenase iron-sulfur subunit